MTAPFPFDAMLLFAFLSASLLAGIVLRARIGFLQKFLIPSCLIGGVLGLTLMHTGLLNIEVPGLLIFAYHSFNISFISLGLTRGEKRANPVSGKQMLRGPLWMGLMQGVTFPLQVLVGGLSVILLGFAGLELFPMFGFLVPLGFIQGPGQALAIGKVWEGFGFAHAVTLGLTFATLGFMFAFFVCIPVVRYGIKKGYAAFTPDKLPKEFTVGVLPRNLKGESAGTLTIHSNNAETLAFQAALVGVVYGLTYFFVVFLASVVGPDIAAMLWGFLFFFGLIIAFIVRRLMKIAGIDYLIDPGIQRRITGWSVDFLIVATVAAIHLKILWAYIFPITFMAVISGVLTTLVVVWFGRRLDAFGLERVAAKLGTLTGTVPTGLLLIRIVDPDFRTPVAVELGIAMIFAAPFIMASMLLLNAPILWGWSIGLTLLAYVGIMAIALILLKVFGFFKRPSV